MNLRRKFFDKTPKQTYIHYEEERGAQKIAAALKALCNAEAHKDVVVLCIGTDRSTGDSLGPITGSLLVEKSPRHLHVYGTLEKPVHAVNLESSLDQIHTTHDNPWIVAVDACLGRQASVGHASVGLGPIRPGAGVQKTLPEVGHAHINGIVNVSGFMEFFVLQNTRLFTVMQLSRCIASGIVLWDRGITKGSPGRKLQTLNMRNVASPPDCNIHSKVDE
ncbi:spore protease YyaC [Bacillaceae bacterium SIJ1]|uniref:spore protease YyaC n=1 Tax=Litoribacterium kuwaitense TaxID=1398745 RepID=UPI0013EC4B53|nr:spore protease YyaC [Litoribacterium kuwaitense]NGP45208.1 spore protease YyaC [Litoribacterium kuwaitense]